MQVDDKRDAPGGGAVHPCRERAVLASFLRRRWVRPTVALLLILGVVVGVDSLFIEPFRIEVTHFDIQAPISAPLKIAQLSDLHTHGMGRNNATCSKFWTPRSRTPSSLPAIVSATWQATTNGARNSTSNCMLH